MKLEPVTYTAPIYWASYIINGDHSGLEPDEKAACDKWLESIGNPYAADCADAGFHWNHDANAFALAGDCATYTFLVRAESEPVKP